MVLSRHGVCLVSCQGDSFLLVTPEPDVGERGMCCAWWREGRCWAKTLFPSAKCCRLSYLALRAAAQQESAFKRDFSLGSQLFEMVWLRWFGDSCLQP